ncbi:MAG: acetyltransferase [Candidatus Thermoplasmatota archaeon]
MKKSKVNTRKQQLDHERTTWRHKHRTLGGRVILYPERPPEHINARANKIYNWFWNKILLEINIQEIPAIISTLQDQINNHLPPEKIRMYRTMIGMAEDAYQLKRLDDIKDYEPELMMSRTPSYDSEEGVIYRDGNLYTTDYNEDESAIIIRDIEGVIKDILSSEDLTERIPDIKI